VEAAALWRVHAPAIDTNRTCSIEFAIIKRRHVPESTHQRLPIQETGKELYSFHSNNITPLQQQCKQVNNLKKGIVLTLCLATDKLKQ